MTIRPYHPSDAPALAALGEISGFPYADPDSPLIETCLVAIDENGGIVGAVAAERLVQLYFWRSPFLSPGATKLVLLEVQKIMATELKKKGYNSCEAFLPPQLEKRFGRRLERTLGFVRNWASWARSI